MPGREKVSVSALFEDVSDSNSKVPRVKCKFCANTVAKNKSRMKSHVENCLSCPKLVKEKYKAQSTSSNQNEQKPASDECDADWLMDFSSHETFSKKLKKAPRSKTSVSKFTDTMSSNEQEKLESLFSRAIYASATPFHIMENPHWIKFFKALRPAFVLPSR